MDDFRLNIDLYGDEGDFGLLVISNNRKYDKLPTQSFPLANANPESVGKVIVEYLEKNCLNN